MKTIYTICAALILTFAAGCGSAASTTPATGTNHKGSTKDSSSESDTGTAHPAGVPSSSSASDSSTTCEVGIQGDQGATGAVGEKGDTGPRGLQGETGTAGPKGDTGPAGVGIQGPQGPQGPTGPQGVAGNGVLSATKLYTSTTPPSGDIPAADVASGIWQACCHDGDVLMAGSCAYVAQPSLGAPYASSKPVLVQSAGSTIRGCWQCYYNVPGYSGTSASITLLPTALCSSK